METVKSRQPGPGASRMPPIPMKMNMNSKTGGQSVPVQATQPKLGGSLAVIVPVYGIGIVGFFAFTLYKVIDAKRITCHIFLSRFSSKRKMMKRKKILKRQML